MDVSVQNNTENSRYELLVDSRLAGIADYRVNGDTVVFPHTEIVSAMRGKGLGDQLVQAALDDVRHSGRRVQARCWFVAEFIDQHPEYADLVG
jgi:predicted GNAT family acetyltransferase